MSITINQASLETYKQILSAALQIFKKAKSHFEETGVNQEEIVQARLMKTWHHFHFKFLVLCIILLAHLML